MGSTFSPNFSLFLPSITKYFKNYSKGRQSVLKTDWRPFLFSGLSGKMLCPHSAFYLMHKAILKTI